MRLVRSGCLSLALCAVFACGSDDPIDPPTEDPPGDEGPQPGPATVTLNDGDTPFEGMMVIFHDAAGKLIDAVETDANGTATVTVPPNAMMSLLVQPVINLGVVPTSNIYTIMGIQPNDSYTFQLGPEDEVPGTSYMSPEVVLPGTFEGATNYVYYWGCGNSSTANGAEHVYIFIGDQCLTAGGKFMVLAIARNDGGVPLAFSFIDNQTPVVQPPSVFGGGTPVVNMPAWSTTFTDADIELDDIPLGIFGGLIGYQAMRNGVPLWDQFLEGPGTIHQPNGVATNSGLFGLLFGESDVTLFADIEGAPLADTTLSLESRIAGRILATDLAIANEHRPTLSFFSTAENDEIDGTVACLDFTNFTAPREAFGVATANVIWKIMAPPGMDNLQLPELPTELAGLVPGENTFHERQVVTQFGSTEVDGYDAMRAGGMFDIDTPQFEPSDLPAGAHIDYLQFSANVPAVTKRPPLFQNKPTTNVHFGKGGDYCRTFEFGVR